MKRQSSRLIQAFAIVLASTLAFAQAPYSPAILTPAARTVATGDFLLTWNTGTDTEAITSLSWLGNPNVTATYELNTCGNIGEGNNVQYFGNGWGPPDPESGGFVLVGGGTITPPGTIPWLGQVLPSGTAEVTINSNSTNCPPTSQGINVQTTYRFFHPADTGVNWFEVQRVFDFTETTFAHDLRPYIPRLSINSGYGEVLYPATTGALVGISSLQCIGGCTGPVSAPGAAQLNPPWDSSRGWFAIHNPTTQQGVVVKRVQSADPQGGLIAAQLWVDNDANNSYYTNASSVLLLNPTQGFTGGVVSETETFCFYNSAIWNPSMIPPVGCKDGAIALFPSSLTFDGETVGSVSAAKVASVRNLGPTAVTIASITASGDYVQTNNCPHSLPAGSSCGIAVFFQPSATGIRSGFVSVVDVAAESHQTLSLAGVGVAPQ